jgi:hypothetical protein
VETVGKDILEMPVDGKLLVNIAKECGFFDEY